ncbi:transcription factor E2F6 isoform X2 [Dendrobates tinctorius]|uniref:transcription factor E2F6 isoform X2 n=1 Tax=Dendrobates tinctorius TaxID=92724 RepID=UPI003CC97687
MRVGSSEASRRAAIIRRWEDPDLRHPSDCTAPRAMANIDSDEIKRSSKKSLTSPGARFDASLFYLTRRFMDIIKSAPEGIVNLHHVARQLGVGKRRVYDITNVLDGIRLIQKKSKNFIQWVGSDLNNPGTAASPTQQMRDDISNLSAMEEALDKLILDCAHQLFGLTEDGANKKFAYVTYQDLHRIGDYHEQVIIVVRAPEETKLEVPTPNEECVEIHIKSTKGPIEVFLLGTEQERTDEKPFEMLTKTVKMEPEPVSLRTDI